MNQEKSNRSGINNLLARKNLIGLAVFLIALGLFSFDWPYSFSNRFFNLIGGVSTLGAESVLEGKVPYRDFWTMYAPGQFYFLALIFHLFGDDLWVEVISASIVSALGAYFCYLFVLNLVNKQTIAVAGAAVFVGILYNTNYFQRLGSFPPAITLIFLILFFALLFYKKNQARYLVAAGLSTGILIIFKHDVGGYTTIAILSGLLVFHFLSWKMVPDANNGRSLLSNLVAFGVPAAVLILPILIYFSVVAGQPMLEDLVIFPLTDFRYARPESYPSIIPTGILADSPINTIQNFSFYITFAVPSVLFLLSLIGIALAIKRRKFNYAALGITSSIGFVLHYMAAHVQINTHIVTISLYSFFMAVILYSLLMGESRIRYKRAITLLSLALVSGWFLSLAAKPIYIARENRRILTTSLDLPKVRNFKVSPDENQAFTEMYNFVKSQIPTDQKIFVGLHRHDVIVIGDKPIYYLIDQPIATRYQELHPAITDTRPVQQEIIKNLKEDHVSLVIIKYLFSDEILDEIKRSFLVNLPQIGATDLDDFIRENYEKAKVFGPYEVWILKESPSS